MSEEMVCRKRRLSSFQIIILGFAGVILLGALLLMLPLSTTAGGVTPFNEALFTSTSAVCVTGLVVQDTGSYWSAFGQAVILTLIQIGGLGVVTVAASFALLSGRRISLMQRSTMQDAISAPKVGGIVRLTRFILRGTFLIELIGALAMLPVFCRDYGWHGIWMAVFHSISAFCNAGFDILGTNNNLYPSLTGYPVDGTSRGRPHTADVHYCRQAFAMAGTAFPGQHAVRDISRFPGISIFYSYARWSAPATTIF